VESEFGVLEPIDLDSSCGQNHTFRDLIECGATWHRLSVELDQPVDNRPQEADSYLALERVVKVILDPTIDYFGPAVLTYGFASRALTRHIRSGIAPRLDQHAACELSASGRPICSRLGAAVDFQIESRSSLEVARWIVQQCEFDRLYFYGSDRPLHVSAGPEESRKIVVMVTTDRGRRVPRVVTLEGFLRGQIMDSPGSPPG